MWSFASWTRRCLAPLAWTRGCRSAGLFVYQAASSNGGRRDGSRAFAGLPGAAARRARCEEYGSCVADGGWLNEQSVRALGDLYRGLPAHVLELGVLKARGRADRSATGAERHPEVDGAVDYSETGAPRAREREPSPRLPR